MQVVRSVWGSEKATLVLNKALYRYVALLIVLIVFIHIASLIWVNIRYPYEFNPSPEKFKDHQVPEYLVDKPKFYFHFASYVMTTITTNGYGDILPNKEEIGEVVFSMIVMIVGLICMTSVISMSNSVFASFHESAKRTQLKLKDFRSWFQTLEKTSKAEFPQVFVNALDKFFLFLYTSDYNNLLYDNSFFELLPSHISTDLEIAYTNTKKSVMKKLLNRGYSIMFCVDISKCFQPFAFMKGEKILKRNTVPDGVYWVAKGKIEASYGEERFFIEGFEFGDYFGEFGLFDKRCVLNYSSVEDSVLLYISRRELLEILDRYLIESNDFLARSQHDFNDLMIEKKSKKFMLKFSNISIINQGNMQGMRLPSHQTLLVLSSHLISYSVKIPYRKVNSITIKPSSQMKESRIHFLTATWLSTIAIRRIEDKEAQF